MPQSLFAAQCPGCFPILMQNHQPCKRQHHIITCNGHVPHRVPKQAHDQFDDSNSNVHQRDQKREQQRAFLRIAQHCFCLWQMLFDVQSKRSFLSKHPRNPVSNHGSGVGSKISPKFLSFRHAKYHPVLPRTGQASKNAFWDEVPHQSAYRFHRTTVLLPTLFPFARA